MNTSKCTNCKNIISRVDAEAVEIAVGPSDPYRGFSYSCPNCGSVLSIQMNPLTLKDDTLGEIQTNLERIVETLQNDLSQKILGELEEMLSRRE